MGVANLFFRSAGSLGGCALLAVPMGAGSAAANGPTAEAGNTQAVESKTWVGLDGRRSTAPNPLSTLSYSWSQLAGPAVQLNDAETPVPYFEAPFAPQGVVAQLQLQLVVTDSAGLQDTDTVDVFVTASPDEFQGTLDPGEALDPYRSGPGELTYREAKHFLRRTTFGTTEAQVQALIDMGTDAWMTDQLVKTIDDTDAIEAAGLMPVESDCPSSWRKGTQEKITDYVLYLLINDDEALLRERMFYFFHDRWATSTRALKGSISQRNHFRYNHARFLQDAALTDDYRQTLIDLVLNESMLVWLDGATPYQFFANEFPNENFIREFWELFTLGVSDPVTGEPAYCEGEIFEGALALTGTTLGSIQGDPCARHKVYFNPASHSNQGPFQLFDGEFDGQMFCTLQGAVAVPGVDSVEGVVDATLLQRGAKNYLAHQIASFVWGIEPPTALVVSLADDLELAWDANGDYSIHGLLRKVATSKAMFAPEVRKAKVRTPVDFAVRGVRTIGLDMGKKKLRERLDVLEHYMLDPPSVEGWPEDETWIAAGTQVLRMELANELMEVNSDPGTTPDVSRFFPADPDLNDAASLLMNVLRIFDIGPEHYPLSRFRGWVGYMNALTPSTPGEFFDLEDPEHQKQKALGALWIALCVSEGAAL